MLYSILYVVLALMFYLTSLTISVDSLINSLVAQGTDIEQLFHLSKLGINGNLINDTTNATFRGNPEEVKELFGF